MGLADSAKGLGKKFKLDSHHAIERFGVIFSVLFVIGSVLLGSTMFSAWTNTRAALDERALYVTSFTTSRTQVQGEVSGLYVNPERNRAMVMMKFDDPTQVSSTASSYKAFLTGSSPDLRQEPLKTQVAAQIVVFGATGYMGVVFDSNKPFPQQVYNLTMRSNSELVYPKGDPRIRKDLRDDSSFLAHDQWRLYFNPGAQGATVVQSLSGRTLDVGAVYAEVVTAGLEAPIRQQLEEQLELMRTNLNRVQEFEEALGRTSTLDGDFLVPPRGETPQPTLIPIAGDKIVGDPATVDKDGNPVPSTLELETDWVAPDGFDFDWRSGSVKEGYLADLVPAGERYGTWLTAKAQMGANATRDQRFNSSRIEWALTDGTLLKDHISSRTAGMTEVVALQGNLNKAYDDYWRSKETYQVKLPMQLLELEVAQRSVEQSFSVNNDEDVVYFY